MQFFPETDLDLEQRIEARRAESGLTPWRRDGDGTLWFADAEYLESIGRGPDDSPLRCRRQPSGLLRGVQEIATDAAEAEAETDAAADDKNGLLLQLAERVLELEGRIQALEQPEPAPQVDEGTDA